MTFLINRNDDWFGQDKNLHFAACAAITLALTIFSGSLLYGAVGAFAVGLAKEIRDAIVPTSGFSLKDLAADVAGIAFASLAYLSYAS